MKELMLKWKGLEGNCHALIEALSQKGMRRAGDTSQSSLCHWLDSNAAPPEYEPKCVIIMPILSIKCCVANNSRHMPNWTSLCETWLKPGGFLETEQLTPYRV